MLDGRQHLVRKRMPEVQDGVPLNAVADGRSNRGALVHVFGMVH